MPATLESWRDVFDNDAAPMALAEDCAPVLDAEAGGSTQNSPRPCGGSEVRRLRLPPKVDHSNRFQHNLNCMTGIGKVSKGAVKLPPGIDLPDGTPVELTLPKSTAASSAPSDRKRQPRTGRWIPSAKCTKELTGQQANEFTELLEFSGETINLPANHDYYLRDRSEP